MKLYHYYHAYLNEPGWVKIVGEHFKAVYDSGLYAQLAEPVHVGLVGGIKEQTDFWEYMKWLGVPYQQVNANEGRWEQTTLFPMWWRSHVMDGAVLYAHTKGAAHPSPIQDHWRKKMTDLVVGEWSSCVDMLELFGIDVAGAYRIMNDGSKDAFGRNGADQVADALNKDLGLDLEVGPVFPEVGKAIFAGNFFWSTWKWIRSLNAPGMASRYDAEQWIGNANIEGREPTVFNMEEWLARDA